MTGATITKVACTRLFNWIVDNNLFNIVKLCAVVHDEICIEYPKIMPEVAKVLEDIMEKSSALFCKFSKIPASAEVSDHWVH